MATISAPTAITLFKEQVKDARGLLEGTMADVTEELATWQPGGKAIPIGAHYAHVVTAQDMGLHGLLKGTAPLIASSWAERAGLSEPPPFGPGSPLDEWALKAKISLQQLREYASAIYAATDEYLDTLTENQFSRRLDLSAFGFGEQPASFILINGWINNVWLHCGEISCLKGVQGQKGYPV